MTNKTITIYNLSKELKRKNKDILDICSELKIMVKAHSSSLNEEDANKIRQYINNNYNNSQSMKKPEFENSSKPKTKSKSGIKARKPRTKKPTIVQKSEIKNNKPQIEQPTPHTSSISIISEQLVKDENIIIEKNQEKTLESNYVPFISFNDSQQQEKANKYISEQVQEFFEFLQEDFKEFSYFEYSKTISDLDFSGSQKKPIDYFYNHLLIELAKTGRDENGKIISPKKWTVTFDINYTRIVVPKLKINNSGKLHRHFGTIDVGGTPILYYIYFTLQEILDAIRDNK